jgi:hypothetical protein
MSEKRKREISPEIKAWAAGFFDGEGTLALRKTHRCATYFLLVRVSNLDRKVLEELRTLWGGRIYKRPGTGSNRRPYYEWSLSPTDAVTFLKDIQPFVRTEKNIKRINLAIRFQDGKVQGRIPSNLLQAKIAEETKLHLEIAELNKRGINV